MAALALWLGGRAVPVQAQITEQVLSFSFICQFSTNVFTTNSAAGITNDERVLNSILIDTPNIVRAIAIDLDGTNWVRKWYPAVIVRDVNLADGSEGIFLRHGTTRTNLSERFFGQSFSNEFSGNVSNVFLATNYTTFPVQQGWRYLHPTNTITNFSRCDGLYFVSFTSSNTQFNLFGYGQGTERQAGGYLDGKLYEMPTVSTEIIGAGSFNLNLTTNIYLTPTTNGTPAYVNGLLHGSIVISGPTYVPVQGP